jgi:hypothetical protein
VSPTLSARIFRLSIDNDGIIITRLFGIRDLVLGAILLKAAPARWSPSALTSDPIGHQAALKQVLQIGAIIDAVDVCSSTIGVADGSLVGPAVGLVGGGAAFFCVLAWIGIRG